jgi:hypothetical protein
MGLAFLSAFILVLVPHDRDLIMADFLIVGLILAMYIIGAVLYIGLGGRR